MGCRSSANPVAGGSACEREDERDLIIHVLLTRSRARACARSLSELEVQTDTCGTNRRRAGVGFLTMRNSAEEPQLGCSSEKHHAHSARRSRALDCSAAPQPDSLPCRRCFREFEDVRRVDISIWSIWPRAHRRFQVSFSSVSDVRQFQVHEPNRPNHAATPTDKLEQTPIPDARQQRLSRVESLGLRV